MFRLGPLYYPLCRTRAGRLLIRKAVRGIRTLGGLRGFRMPLDGLELDHPAVVGLSHLWSRIHWSSGDGMMPAEELLTVYGLAATWDAEGDIVELGAWTGLTTCYLGTACRVRGFGRVHAVDTFEGTREHQRQYGSIKRFGGNTLDAFNANVRAAGLEDIVGALIGFTADVGRHYSGPPIRMLLIDADHSYEGVRTDFEIWHRHVAPGGLIVFHDYLMTEVRRFVNDLNAATDGVSLHPAELLPNLFAVTKTTRPARGTTPVTPRPASVGTEVAVASVS